MLIVASELNQSVGGIELVTSSLLLSVLLLVLSKAASWPLTCKSLPSIGSTSETYANHQCTLVVGPEALSEGEN